MGQEITSKGASDDSWRELKGLPDEPLISRLTLRSMKQAKYTTECSVAILGWRPATTAHFTSPIRQVSGSSDPQNH